MHILYIHQHFATPKGSSATRSYEFARRWIKAGHKVTLITGYYDIGGLKLGKALIQKQTIEGINVVIVGTKYSNNSLHYEMLKCQLSFIYSSFMYFSKFNSATHLDIIEKIFYLQAILEESIIR